MTQALSDALSWLCYGAIAAAAVAAQHYGWVDNTFETVVLTGTLYHLGLKYYPNGINAVQPSSVKGNPQP